MPQSSIKPMKSLFLKICPKTTTHFNILNTVPSLKIQDVITALNTYGQKQQLTKILNLAANIKVG